MTRVRYDRLIEAGIFGPEDLVELLDGLLVAREAQSARHATAVGLVHAALARGFGRAYHIREATPIALDGRSEPEPDVAVVPGRLRDYVAAHPSRPVLVVEVADSSLALDRLRKGGWKYDSVRLLRRNAIVTPLAAPRARIRIEALVP